MFCNRRSSMLNNNKLIREVKMQKTLNKQERKIGIITRYLILSLLMSLMFSSLIAVDAEDKMSMTTKEDITRRHGYWNDNKPTFSVFAGYTMSGINSKDDITRRHGYNLGMTYAMYWPSKDSDFYKGSFFEPGFRFISRGYRKDIKDEIGQKMKYEINMEYFEVFFRLKADLYNDPSNKLTYIFGYPFVGVANSIPGIPSLIYARESVDGKKKDVTKDYQRYIVSGLFGTEYRVMERFTIGWEYNIGGTIGNKNKNNLTHQALLINMGMVF